MAENASGKGGRPWGELKGGRPEANDLATAMRKWLRASGMTARQFHAKLQPEDFTGGRIPSIDTVYSRFAGIAPDWEFVSAVVHICSPDVVTMNKWKGEAQELWKKWVAAERDGKKARKGVAQHGGLVVEVPDIPGLPATASADERLLAAYDKIQQMYEAQLIATKSHHRLEMLLFLMLGRENDHLQHIARLEQQLDSVMEQRTPDPAQIATLRTMIEEAEVRERQLLQARDKAQTERDIAQQMLDHANRTIKCLQEEIERLKAGAVSMGTTVVRLEDAFVSGLNDVDGALGQIQRILEEEHDQLYRLRRRLGWRLVDGGIASAPHVIAGQVVDPAGREHPITPDNPPTGQLAASAFPDNPATGHALPKPRPPALLLAQRIGRATASAKSVVRRGVHTAVPYTLRFTVLVMIAVWSMIVGSTFTEIRRGDASLLSVTLSAVAGLVLLGCFQIRVRQIVKRGMTREHAWEGDSLFIGTTRQRVIQYYVRTPTLLQLVGLAPSLTAPQYLGPLDTLGRELAHFLGMA
ncbi:hypothetical protein [Streptomyces sp. SudanB25_2051]|uniref:hypothetical protein n=1 Tax=Streptomyces sp. SudanB25_2051 TaxID=3035275 RepID=UPI003F57BEB3